MRILIAPDKLKGSCTALAAAEAIARGLRKVWPDAELQLAPIADGGEGFAEAVRAGLGGEWITLEATDSLGRRVSARYLWVPQRKLAALEVSEASGLWRVASNERDAERATSYGTGELIRAAAERGAEVIMVGLGGSATTDGGVGVAAALGFEFFDQAGKPYVIGSGDLSQIERISSANAVSLPKVIAASDVQNPLLGERGTAPVFAAQKGADAGAIENLERGLAHFADVVQRALGCDFRNAAGAGAAGGIGFGLLTFCGAELQSGFEVVAQVLGLEELVRSADLVITGEGRIDGQTFEGKGPAELGRLAKRYGKPVVAFAGLVAKDVSFDGIFDSTCAIIDEPIALAEALARGEEFLERAAERMARLWQVRLPVSRG